MPKAITTNQTANAQGLIESFMLTFIVTKKGGHYCKARLVFDTYGTASGRAVACKGAGLHQPTAPFSCKAAPYTTSTRFVLLVKRDLLNWRCTALASPTSAIPVLPWNTALSNTKLLLSLTQSSAPTLLGTLTCVITAE
jgi:hypothetical protein